MISIAAATRRCFTLPADVATTTAYFRDLERTLRDLPHLSLVRTHGPDRYRILYSAAESGVYHVALYCDIQVQFDATTQTIDVTPATGIPPVPPKVTVNSLTGQGNYSSRAVLRSAGSSTGITYERRDQGSTTQTPSLDARPRSGRQARHRGRRAAAASGVHQLLRPARTAVTSV